MISENPTSPEGKIIELNHKLKAKIGRLLAAWSLFAFMALGLGIPATSQAAAKAKSNKLKEINYPTCATYDPTAQIKDTFSNRLQLFIVTPGSKRTMSQLVMLLSSNALVTYFGADWYTDLAPSGCQPAKSEVKEYTDNVPTGTTTLVNTFENNVLIQQVENGEVVFKYTYASSGPEMGSLTSVTADGEACVDLTYDAEGFNRVTQIIVSAKCAFNGLQSKSSIEYDDPDSLFPNRISNYFMENGKYSLDSYIEMSPYYTNGKLSSIQGYETDYIDMKALRKQLKRHNKLLFKKAQPARLPKKLKNTQQYTFTMAFTYDSTIGALEKMEYKSPGGSGFLPTDDPYTFVYGGYNTVGRKSNEMINNTITFDNTVTMNWYQVLSTKVIENVMDKYTFDTTYTYLGGCSYPNCIACSTLNWASDSIAISNYEGNSDAYSLTYLSAENPYTAYLTSSINDVDPVVNASASTGFDYPRYYLAEKTPQLPFLVSGPLTYVGPIGAFGPLSSYGAIGKSAWNPTQWIDDWSKIYGEFFKEFDYFVAADGPLTIDGPLGSSGPYTTTAYCTTLPSINDFGKHLQAGGIWSILGPAGPLGPVGPLGPLGPNGTAAVLYPPNSNGNYIDPKTGAIVTSVDILNTDNSVYRTYPLYELYKASYAIDQTNDLSWMVSDASVSGTNSQTWKVQADYSQYVSVLALDNDATDVSLKQLQLAVQDTSSQYTLYANEPVSYDVENYQYVNQLFFLAQAGHTYDITVKAADSNNISTISYRLLVTGSTKYLSGSDITGNHQAYAGGVTRNKTPHAIIRPASKIKSQSESRKEKGKRD